MGKLIFLLVIVVVIVYLIKRGGRSRPSASPPPGTWRPGEDMVRCHVCDVNLPRSEAILSRGRFYCCDEHRRRDEG